VIAAAARSRTSGPRQCFDAVPAHHHGVATVAAVGGDHSTPGAASGLLLPPPQRDAVAGSGITWIPNASLAGLSWSSPKAASESGSLVEACISCECTHEPT